MSGCVKYLKNICIVMLFCLFILSINSVIASANQGDLSCSDVMKDD